MRAVVQRVSEAAVDVDGVCVGAIGEGLLVLLCAMAGDTPADERWLLEKVLALRVFADDAGKMNLALADLAARAPSSASAASSASGASSVSGASVFGPGLLVVSQFTLAASLSPGLSKGNRPAFTAAQAPAEARLAVDRFVAGAQAGRPWLQVATGQFGADMKVRLVNDGPVTLVLDSRAGSPGPGSSSRTDSNAALETP
jgi:D-tyrosyl-tRNA(Tyr) deacylase